MDILGDIGGFAHPGTADIGFIRQKQRRGNRVHRSAVALVVVADGGDNGSDLLRREIHPVQNPEGHHRAALTVVHPVDHIADIVEVPGNPGQFHGSFRIAQCFQNVSGGFCHPGDMGEAVFRKAQSLHGGICLGDIYLHRRVPADFFIRHFFFPHFLITIYRYSMQGPGKKCKRCFVKCMKKPPAKPWRTVYQRRLSGICRSPKSSRSARPMP